MRNKDVGRHRTFSNDIPNSKLLQYTEKLIRSIKRELRRI
ncbi:hypothetical protein DFH77_004311 [Clostridium beijerinckii]|nr:hypothetical protein [Clostridium beijerinckii]NRZ67282.1 hypothetical protein [Clostridium beijerinckii]